MELSAFLTQLAESGVAVVTGDEALEPGDGAEKIVCAWDAVQRGELAGAAPELIPAVAEWAAVRLYRGCQALVCRELPPAEMQAMLREPCPAKASAAADYSADLVFRFLPDLVALARRVARSDPLVDELLALARAWPLSSVGIGGVGAVEAARVLAQPALRQLYVDRIIATGDAARLADDAVRAAVKSALGAFPGLAPALAAAMNPAP